MNNYITNVKKIAQEYNLKLEYQREKARKYLIYLAQTTLNEVKNKSFEDVTKEEYDLFEIFLKNIMEEKNDIKDLYNYYNNNLSNVGKHYTDFDFHFLNVVSTMWIYYENIEII